MYTYNIIAHASDDAGIRAYNRSIRENYKIQPSAKISNDCTAINNTSGFISTLLFLNVIRYYVIKK